MKTTPLILRITLIFVFAMTSIFGLIYWSKLDERARFERLAIDTYVRIGVGLERELDRQDFGRLAHEASEAGLDIVCLDSSCGVPSGYELVKKDAKDGNVIEVYKDPQGVLAMRISYTGTQLFLHKEGGGSSLFEEYGMFAVLGLIGILLFFMWASVLRFVLPLEKNIRELLGQKEQMLAMMSHEIKTPLAKAKLALEFIDDSKHKSSIKKALADIDALSVLMLANAEIVQSRGQGSLFLASLAVSDALGMLASAEGIEVDTLEDFEIQADKNEFTLAVKNLLENGIKHSDDGNVSVTITSGALTVSNGAKRFGGELGRLAEPFYKSGATSGHGLGLHIVQKIAEKWGFALQFELNNGRFTALLARKPCS